MAWTDEDIKAVREAIKKQEELIRPKMVGIERLMEILKREEQWNANHKHRMGD